MKRKMAIVAFVFASCVAGVASAQDPSLHEVYEAAQAGNMTEAQRMMDKVLADHPNSAKAHFVEAELLARQGRNSQAQSELATAERLNPGLTDENPRAVQDLRARIGAGGSAMSGQHMVGAPVTRGGISMGMIIVILALVAFVVFVARAMGRRNTVVYGPNGAPVGGFGPGQPMQAGYGPGVYPGGPMGGGMGSGILGGLATGAALGAGVVAGEELMHHFTDHNGNSIGQPIQDASSLPPDNMGGSNFGVNDPGSWDDSSSSSWDSGSSGGGGDDWA